MSGKTKICCTRYGNVDLLEGKEAHCEYDGLTPVPDAAGKFCYVPVTHKVTLGEIVDLLQEFKEQPSTLMMPKMPEGSFAKKLFSLYLTYLPKEKFRYPLKIVDIISDVNLAYSEHARKYLHECGLPKERVYVTGSPMAEVLHQNLAKIEASDVHEKLGLEKGKYILLSAHREENIDTEKNFISLFTAINRMAEKYDMPILYSCHPRSRNRLKASGFQLDPRVIQHEPLGFHDYNCLQMHAFAVVSDSGTLPEESSFFTSVGHPFPAVCIRTSTERPEALDKACFVLAGIDEKSLLQAVDTAVQMNLDGDYGIPVPDYVEENVSTKVVKIIQSYTGVVNKMVWRK